MGSIYKYINKTTGIVEYVGIVYDRPLYKRLYEHNKYDGMDGNNYIVQYIKCNSRTDLEYLEDNFISKWKTYKFLNRAKSSWGESKLIDDDFEWIEVSPYIVNGFTVNDTARHYAKLYIRTPDENKWKLYNSIKCFDDEENSLYFNEVRELIPNIVKQLLFKTKNDMIQVCIENKYLTIGICGILQLEAFYFCDDDTFLMNPHSFFNRNKQRKTREEYFEIVHDYMIALNTFYKQNADKL